MCHSRCRRESTVVAEYFPRPFERTFDRRREILVANVLVELSAFHHARGLITHAAQDEGSTSPMKGVSKMLQSMQPGAVDRRHVPQS